MIVVADADADAVAVEGVVVDDAAVAVARPGYAGNDCYAFQCDRKRA